MRARTRVPSASGFRAARSSDSVLVQQDEAFLDFAPSEDRPRARTFGQLVMDKAWSRPGSGWKDPCSEPVTFNWND